MQTVRHTSDDMANLNIAVTSNKAYQEIQLRCTSQSSVWFSLNTINKSWMRHIIIIIIIFITFIQGIYNYISEATRVYTVYSVAAVLYLQFMSHVTLFSMLNVFCIFTLAPSAVYVRVCVCVQWPTGMYSAVP